MGFGGSITNCSNTVPTCVPRPHPTSRISTRISPTARPATLMPRRPTRRRHRPRLRGDVDERWRPARTRCTEHTEHAEHTEAEGRIKDGKHVVRLVRGARNLGPRCPRATSLPCHPERSEEPLVHRAGAPGFFAGSDWNRCARVGRAVAHPLRAAVPRVVAPPARWTRGPWLRSG